LDAFKTLLKSLRPQNASDLEVTPAPGGTSILEICFSKEHYRIIKAVLENPFPLPEGGKLLFVRYL
jgi:hypothetical protein